MLLVILTLVYIERIKFGSDIKVEKDCRIKSVNGLSPINKEKQFEINDSNYQFTGYLKSLRIESNGKINPNEIKISINDNPKISLVASANDDGCIIFDSHGLSFFDKIYIFCKVNLFKILLLILVSVIYLLFLIFPDKFIKPIKSWWSKRISKIKSGIVFIKSNWTRLVYSVVTSTILLLLLRFLFGIKFEILYFADVWLINTIVFIFLLIPITAIFFFKRIPNEKRFSFFSFWIIIFSLYFFVAPDDFVGNYGFHGFFHDFIIRPQKLGFFNSLLVPDTGYFAIIPRIAYGLAYFTDNLGANSIAITSIIALIIYAWIFSLLCKPRFRFLFENDYLRSVFVIFMSVFSLFSLSVSEHYAISITDVSYYGIILILIILFKDFNSYSWRDIALSIFISGLFIFSKAHMISIIPLCICLIIYRLFQKNFKSFNLVYVGIILAFAIGHLVYISHSMSEMSSWPSQNIQSFSIEQKPIFVIIGFSVVYIIKSYSLFLFPIQDTLSGLSGVILSIMGIVLIIGLFLYSLSIFKTEKGRTLALWFYACNIVAFSSAFLFFRTFPTDADMNLDFASLLSYFGHGGVFFSRYTIGVHSVLIISVLPLLIKFIKDKLIRLKTRNNKIFVDVFLVVSFIILSSFLHSKPKINTVFWKKAMSERWSEEWYYLSRKLSEKSYYVPINFYPQRKQQIQTEDMQVLFDSDSTKIEEVNFDDWQIKTIVLINTQEIYKEYSGINVCLTLKSGDSVFIKPDYQVRKYFNYIIFNSDTTWNIKSVIFVEEKNRTIQPGKFRIVGVRRNL